uniref:Putative secreted protein n=1 Tax=Anopheles darlingi TaxID=43151 RepID=A0A2M4DFF8_ANODA
MVLPFPVPVAVLGTMLGLSHPGRGRPVHLTRGALGHLQQEPSVAVYLTTGRWRRTIPDLISIECLINLRYLMKSHVGPHWGPKTHLVDIARATLAYVRALEASSSVRFARCLELPQM